MPGCPLNDATVAAAARWMAGRIDARTTSRETDIPQGLPYLKGSSTHSTVARVLKQATAEF